VKYCNAACKKRHRSKHKKDCEEHLKRVAELHEEELRRAEELHDIELFKSPPRKEDCPICFLRLPMLTSGWRYKSCCGKVICSGCIYAMDKICPFCRSPTPTLVKESIKRTKKRVEVGDAIAISSLGDMYSEGTRGFPQDYTKALELYHRAAELGFVGARHNIGCAYNDGEGVERDMKKAVYYWGLAAMKGYATSRHNLGIEEKNVANFDRAIKHYMIAVESGNNGSLNQIKELYSNGHATKDEYTKALQTYQKYLGEIKSSQRDEAAAANEEYKYIG